MAFPLRSQAHFVVLGFLATSAHFILSVRVSPAFIEGCTVRPSLLTLTYVQNKSSLGDEVLIGSYRRMQARERKERPRRLGTRSLAKNGAAMKHARREAE